MKKSITLLILSFVIYFSNDVILIALIVLIFFSLLWIWISSILIVMKGTWDGTCLRALLTDWLVWLPIIIFVSIRIQAYVGVEQPANFVNDILGQSNVAILGGFVSFLLVIFVNQTNERYLSMYQLSKRCCGLIQDTAGLVSCQFPDSAEKERLICYMNASHVAGYVGLGGPYSKRNFFDHFNQEHNLLNKAELEKLDHYNMD
jgi:hypothetical protein